MTTCSIEKWVAVPGFRGSYEISNLGRVRSLDRENLNRNGVRRVLRGKVLTPSLDSEGYLQVGLLRDGIEKKRRIHRLIAEVFILNRDDLPMVDHIDRVRLNNSISNLRWASSSDNRKNTAYRRSQLSDLEKASA